MIERLKPKSKFGRNVLTLMAGTTVAQIIPVLITPVLTRLWTPEEFGTFASYMALTAILGVAASGRLDMALLLPRRNDDAVRIMIVAFSLSSFFMLLAYFFILIFDYIELSSIVKIQAWHYLVPIGVILHASYSLVIAWHNRNRHYSLMNKSRVIQAGSISFSQVIVGLGAKFNLGLIVSDLFGRFISVILIVRESRLLQYKLKLSFARKIALLKRYRKFPLLEAPASLVNVLSHQLPFITLPLIFSPTIAGLYFLVYRVLMMPASLIGTSVLEVFRNRAQEDYKRTASCRNIFVKTGIMLFVIGIFPATILILFSPILFVFVFGEEWREAGQYAQILAPLAFARFVSAPLSYVLVFREKLHLDLKLQLFFLALVAMVLWITSELMSIRAGVWLLMFSGVLFYFLQVIFSYKFSKGSR